MDVPARVAFENLNRATLLVGVPGAYPEQQPTVIELLLKTSGALVAQKLREPCSNPPAPPPKAAAPAIATSVPPAAAYRAHRETRPNVEERTDDSSLSITNRLRRRLAVGTVGLSSSSPGFAILVTELGYDVSFTGD